jgi:S-disulfanyl-L-cysteine oxidoreductase SoxD
MSDAPIARARELAGTRDVGVLRDTTVVTTMDGVYTLAQATKGSDVFAQFCKSCHTPTVHSGPPFRAKWFGRSLSDLYGYLRREMPKNEPGSMSDVDYARALAYLLRINGMPAGSVPLAADSAALHRIRLDSVRAAPTATGNRP